MPSGCLLSLFGGAHGLYVSELGGDFFVVLASGYPRAFNAVFTRPIRLCAQDMEFNTEL